MSRGWAVLLQTRPGGRRTGGLLVGKLRNVPSATFATRTVPARLALDVRSA
jgi:hypothetical protein